MKFENKVNILNRKARFNYELIEQYDAGIMLSGTEIKSIRMGKASIAESFCQFVRGELYIINMTIEEYYFGNIYNHKIKRERKLLLQKKELRKLERKVTESGYSIIPTKIYITDKGFAKVQLFMAKGKKLYDKREVIKERENSRDLERLKKNF